MVMWDSVGYRSGSQTLQMDRRQCKKKVAKEKSEGASGRGRVWCMGWPAVYRNLGMLWAEEMVMNMVVVT